MALTDAQRQRRLRERRAKLLEPGDPVLRAADDLVTPAVQASLEALGLGPEHAAAAALALRYSKCLDRAQDAAWAARWIGPLLLDCLGELGATPAARVKVRKDTGPREPSALDRLRQARRTYPGA
jgi:hypothetical protein